MKYRRGLRNILLSVFLLIGFTSAFSQNDTIASKNIKSKSKPLQFGNELLLSNQAGISESVPDHFVISGSAMDYIQSRMTYDPIRDPKRLGFNTALYIGGTFLAFTILWVAPESFSGWDKDQMREEGLISRWKENVQAGPVWDNDDFF